MSRGGHVILMCPSVFTQLEFSEKVNKKKQERITEEEFKERQWGKINDSNTTKRGRENKNK